jgi:restriction system protein
METLLHPLLLGLLVALLAGGAAAYFLGFRRHSTLEADAGVRSLCAMKWRDYAHLIEDLLRERGFVRTGEERRPGEDGFDLLMARGSSRYLVECKNSAAHSVTAQVVRDLAAVVDLQGVEGAVLATTGTVDAAALELAANRRVEILTGAELWRQVKPWVPHDLLEEAQAHARAGDRRKLIISSAVALVAGIVVALSASMLAPEPASAPASAGAAASVVVAPAPSATPATSAAGMPAKMPDASLTEAALASRRASAALEVRGNPLVQHAVWSTKSTMVVTLHQPGAQIPDSLFDEVCRILVQYEELRYSRVQMESPPAPAAATETEASQPSSSSATVRWKSCL